MKGSAEGLFRSSLLIIVVLLLPACGTLPNSRGWGEDATLLPGWERVGQAAVRAARSPVTWAPAAGALVFGLTDLDQRTADWAADKTPLFGSQGSAGRASDYLAAATVAGAVVTAVAAPGGETAGAATRAKLKGAGVEIAAGGVVGGLTTLLKVTTDRRRPNGSNRNSFPSGHSAEAFTGAALANRNLESLQMPRWSRLSLQAMFLVTATGVAWARVEAHVHYPSDVLAGAALANFLSLWIHDAFLGLEVSDPVLVAVVPERKGWLLALRVPF